MAVRWKNPPLPVSRKLSTATMIMAAKARIPTLSCDHFTFSGEAISLGDLVFVLHEFDDVWIPRRFKLVLVTFKNKTPFTHHHESRRCGPGRLKRTIVRIVTEIGYEVPVLI